jgi:hypothetical protein
LSSVVSLYSAASIDPDPPESIATSLSASTIDFLVTFHFFCIKTLNVKKGDLPLAPGMR